MSRSLKLFYTTLHLQWVEGKGSLGEQGSQHSAAGPVKAAEGMVGYGKLSGGLSMGIIHFLYPLSPILLLLMFILLSHYCFQ